VLPAGLEKLLMEETHSHPLNLPTQLKVLDIDKYTLPIRKGSLPMSLEELSIGCQTIEKGALPEGLKKLFFNEEFSQDLEGVLPSSLECLEFLDVYPCPMAPGILPEGLSVLKLTTKEVMYYHAETINPPFLVGALPQSLKHLSVCMYQGQFLPGLLPDKLEILELNGFNQQLLPGGFPTSLKELTLGYTFGSPIESGVFGNCESVNLYRDHKTFRAASDQTGLKVFLPYNYPTDRIAAEYLPSIV
jgi:hypothetical protein